MLLHEGVDFPYVHDLDRLLGLVEGTGVGIPEGARQAGKLSRYALFTRYPGFEEVTEEHHRQAMEIATAVVKWAESVILGEPSA